MPRSEIRRRNRQLGQVHPNTRRLLAFPFKRRDGVRAAKFGAITEDAPARTRLFRQTTVVALESLKQPRNPALAKVREPILNWRPVAAALVTGVFIALYTVTDGLGVRRHFQINVATAQPKRALHQQLRFAISSRFYYDEHGS